MKRRNSDYERGYQDGYHGRQPANWKAASMAYEHGWDDGNCDRPSLDELTLDVAKERRDPLGY